MEENGDKEGKIDLKKLNAIMKVREKVFTVEFEKLDKRRMEKQKNNSNKSFNKA